jgi:ubiquinone/menaquinone biosynthesis C-methylase UbiE
MRSCNKERIFLTHNIHNINKYIMKKLLLLIIMASSLINGMNNNNTPDNWNAVAYELYVAEITSGYAIDAMIKSKFLTSSDKKILDAGCGTGCTAAKLIEQKLVQQAHGIDPSQHMINFAQNKHRSTNGLTFAHTSIEKFNATEKYDAATMFFCLNEIKNKSLALKKINQALKDNGEFFGTIRTHPTPELDTLVTRIMDYKKKQREFLSDQSKHERRLTTQLNKQINENPTITTEQKKALRAEVIQKQRQQLNEQYPQDPTADEFKAMLIDNGFEIISYEIKDLTLITTKQNTIEKFLWSLIFYHPLIQSLLLYERRAYCTHYMNNYIKNIEQPARTANNKPSELEQCRSDLKQSRKKQFEDNNSDDANNNNSSNIDITSINAGTLTQDDEIVLSSSIENCNPELLAALQHPMAFNGKEFYIAPLIRNTIVFHVRKIKNIDETKSPNENSENSVEILVEVNEK